MKIPVIVFVLSMLATVLQAQFLPDIPSSPFLPDSGRIIGFNLETKSFFKNNEYFTPIEEGYSLLGFYAEPKICFQPYKNFRLSAGICLLKYSGREEFSIADFLFRIQYQPTEWFQMVMGNIFGGNNHRLYEPLYQWERDFTKPVESGLQFLIKTRHVDADLWLNWERFIFHNDPFQEELSGGMRSEFLISSPERNTRFYIPFQVLFQHHGGQINTGGDTLLTIANVGTGIRITNRNMAKGFKGWDVELLYFSYNDLSPTKRQLYKNGWGLYPKGQFYISDFTIGSGYFHGNEFMAPIGERLFHSARIPYTGISRENVKLITAKFIYDKVIHPGISLGAYVETYSDLKLRETDYDYGVHIILNSNFLFGPAVK